MRAPAQGKLGSKREKAPAAAAAKIEAPRPGAYPPLEDWTPIYKVSNGGIDTYEWLCDACVAKRKRKAGGGWDVKEVGLRPGSLAPQRCSDCVRAAG